MPIACTDNFEEANINPVEISDKQLEQDFNHIGSFYPAMLEWVIGYTWWHQVYQNLSSDAWVRYLAPPTPFQGGTNNTTYKVQWKHFYWDRVYTQIMAPSNEVMKTAEEGGYDVFVEWARLIRLMSISKLTLQYGPVIYSDYGSADKTVYYDAEEALYDEMFKDLDKVHAVFLANQDYKGLARFDDSFGGDMSKWIKVINSMRLRLAMRISKVKPDLALAEGNKALSAEGGLILENADNYKIGLGIQKHPLALLSFDWNDTRMSGTMESILVGYKDDRISKYFNPVEDLSLVPDHPEYPYKGIRSGAQISSKDQRIPYSTVNDIFKTKTDQEYFVASETQFIMAEAALRGWNVEKTAQDYYEAGIRLSFERWGANGVDEYILDETSLPIDYDDVIEEGDINDFTNKINITIKWDDSVGNEEKLERIITQKWIAGFPNSWEPWADHSRTGYPKLPYNYKNDSDNETGVVADDDFIKRMKFVPDEYTINPEGVADATKKLSNGKDEIGTRLWWHIAGPNF